MFALKKMTKEMHDEVLAMVEQFYHSDAVCHPVPEERLEQTASELNEQILGIEQVDLASAITDFSWAQYCYNAALKVGNSILSQSLIDYMS